MFSLEPRSVTVCIVWMFPYLLLQIVCFFFLYFLYVDEYAYLILDFGLHRIVTHFLLTLAEVVIFKIIYMYKFSIIAGMDEYFLTNLVTLLNCMSNFGLATTRISLGEHRRTKIYFHNFAKPTELYYKIPWP